MTDRREEFKDVPWQQGRLLYTQSVRRYPKKWQVAADQEEKRRLFAHFCSSDNGISREFLFCFDTAEECAEAVKAHNLELAGLAPRSKE